MITWTIKDMVEVIKDRIDNKFDCNIAVSGARGNGKSTFLFKLFSRFDFFDPWKQQVYCREDVIHLLKQKKGIIFDDEAINSGYKRSFYNPDQQELIKMMTMYRDNFNIYGVALPNFYSLDKDIRFLVKIHVHILERGFGVIHVAKEDALYSSDPWDVRYNQKLEDKWSEKKKRDPSWHPPFHRLSTFQGYIRFGDLSTRKRELYETIKRKKKSELYELSEEEERKKDPKEQLYFRVIELLQKGYFKTIEELYKIPVVSDIKLKTFSSQLSTKLKEQGLPSASQIIKDQQTNQSSPLVTPPKQQHNQHKYSSRQKDEFGFDF